MLQSRSQTKIKRTQQVNLLAEQRYLKQKSLLTEAETSDFLLCFEKLGYSEMDIPEPCKVITTKEEFLTCRTFVMNSLHKMSTTTPTNVYNEFFTCMTTKATELGLFQEPVNPIGEPPTEEENPEEGSEENK